MTQTQIFTIVITGYHGQATISMLHLPVVLHLFSMESGGCWTHRQINGCHQGKHLFTLYPIYNVLIFLSIFLHFKIWFVYDSFFLLTV